MTTPIDYSSKDYLGFRSSMLDYAARKFPEWTSRNEADFGVALVEMVAYFGDIMSYYGDRANAEAYITTAVQRRSVMNIAKMLAYNPTGPIAATGTVTFVSDAATTAGILIPAGTQVITDFVQQYDSPVFFETAADVTCPQAGGTVIATIVEGQTQGSNLITINQNTPYVEDVVVDNLGTSDGTVDQIIQIPVTPAIQSTVRVFSTMLDVNNNVIYVEWQKFDSIIDANAFDRAYTVTVDEFNNTYVIFGDGINGQIPTASVSLFVHYRVGGGLKGNLPINSISDIGTTLEGVAVQSSSATTGGANPETTAQIRQNAPLAFRTQDRAVTNQDYADLALGVTAVSKAAAVANSCNNVTVFIVGPDGTVATQALRDATKIYLDDRRMAGTTVTVSNATVIPVNVCSTGTPGTVGVKPTYRRAVVLADVNKALQTYFALINVNFGQRVSLSDIYTTIAQVPGVQYSIVPLMARADAVQTGNNDIQLKAWEIPSAGNIVFNITGGIA